MNRFERFRNRNLKHGEAAQEVNTHFIFKGYPSTKLQNKNTAAWLEEIRHKILYTENNEPLSIDITPVDFATEIQAAVVNQQEKDKAYIYTQFNTPLPMGSIWGAKTLY